MSGVVGDVLDEIQDEASERVAAEVRANAPAAAAIAILGVIVTGFLLATGAALFGAAVKAIGGGK